MIHTTHQCLADDLGTARERVSRQLKRLEETGLVQLARERVRILDAPDLRKISRWQDHG